MLFHQQIKYVNYGRGVPDRNNRYKEVVQVHSPLAQHQIMMAAAREWEEKKRLELFALYVLVSLSQCQPT